jgi:DNA-binding response OmpR family regulator/tRNA A-37 threonylcarbamoyl transferase component Bud32
MHEAKPRLLVVDDDSMNREMLSRRLERNGYQVAAAADGVQALDMISSQAFDLVLLDVMMPGIDGFEVLRRLRQTFALQALPVIMATARDGSDSVVRALQLGANDYVAKPLNFQVLLARIQTQLSMMRRQDARWRGGGPPPDSEEVTLDIGRVPGVVEPDHRIGVQAPSRSGLPAMSIGRYQLEELIGKGGMGVVYLARDPALDRPVAIKMMRDDSSVSESMGVPESRHRFSSEARAVARLSHLNIVTIFDVGEEAGHPFIAMEFVSGHTLASLLASGERLPLDRQLDLMEQLCSGLAHAHRAGIVHRDIKPANLVVTADGVLKILDFGIARVNARLARSPDIQSSAVFGTVSYMSPEQLAGAPADMRSDIFAVGAVFYELLSLRQMRPVAAGSRIADLCARQPEPLATLCPELGEDVITIVSRAIQCDPAARYQSLDVMRDDIVAARAGGRRGSGR